MRRHDGKADFKNAFWKYHCSPAFWGCHQTLWPKATKGRKGFISSHTFQSQSEAQGNGQRLKAGTGSNKHGRTSLLYRLTGSSLASFLPHPRLACQRMALPTLGLALSHQSIIKTISYRHIQRSVEVEVPSSLVTLGCVKLIIKTTYHSPSGCDS